MNTENQGVVGGWNPYHKLTNEDQVIFNEAIKGIIGVNYSPYLVSTQVVAGMNYRFKCSVSLPGPEEVVWKAIVDIFKPLQGNPYVIGITKI